MRAFEKAVKMVVWRVAEWVEKRAYDWVAMKVGEMAVEKADLWALLKVDDSDEKWELLMAVRMAVGWVVGMADRRESFRREQRVKKLAV